MLTPVLPYVGLLMYVGFYVLFPVLVQDYASPYSHDCSDCISSSGLCTLVYSCFFESPKFCAVSRESRKFFLLLQWRIKSNYFSPTLHIVRYIPTVISYVNIPM